VHSAAVHLAAVLAAEKSKVPFYIAGGALAVWAMILSLGLGLRRASFPGSLMGERAVIAISVVLVLGAVSMAVVTSGAPAKAGEASAPQTPSGGAPPASAPSAAPPPAASTPAGSSGGTAPGATTGTSAAPTAPAPSTASSSIKLAAGPGAQLSFDTKQLSAKPGKVSIVFTNATPIEHNATVEQGSKVLGATPTFVGGSRTLTVTLARGAYTFFCSVPGHRQAGMEGTLNVS
jgi:plastocyanin